MASVPLNLLFFPGMIVHELSHYLACVVFGVRVSSVKLFGISEAFVEHEKPSARKGIAITLAPFFVCNALAFLFFNYAVEMAGAQNIVFVLFFWLAIALALFSFPSKQDAANAFAAFIDSYWKKIFGKKSLLEKLFWVVLFPFFFVPLILVLGIMLAFDHSVFLRFCWAIALFFISAEPTLLASPISFISTVFLQFFSGIF